MRWRAGRPQRKCRQRRRRTTRRGRYPRTAVPTSTGSRRGSEPIRGVRQRSGSYRGGAKARPAQNSARLQRSRRLPPPRKASRNDLRSIIHALHDDRQPCPRAPLRHTSWLETGKGANGEEPERRFDAHFKRGGRSFVPCGWAEDAGLISAVRLIFAPRGGRGMSLCS